MQMDEKLSATSPFEREIEILREKNRKLLQVSLREHHEKESECISGSYLRKNITTVFLELGIYLSFIYITHRKTRT